MRLAVGSFEYKWFRGEHFQFRVGLPLTHYNRFGALKLFIASFFYLSPRLKGCHFIRLCFFEGPIVWCRIKLSSLITNYGPIHCDLWDFHSFLLKWIKSIMNNLGSLQWIIVLIQLVIGFILFYGACIKLYASSSFIVSDL